MTTKVETKRRWRSQIDIRTAWCKGCAICVEFCPKNVLAMQGGKVYVRDIESCIVCGLCEIRCPDFCIVVSKVQLPDEEPKGDADEPRNA